MAVLGDIGAVTQRHLTEATLMDKVAVNRACKVLEERGLVERQPNARDGRSHLLDLTSEGKAVHAEVMPLTRESESEIFGALDPEQREQLRALLLQVFNHAKSIRPASH